MTKAELLGLLRFPSHHAVQASVAPGGIPEAAVVGIAVTDSLEIIFDTSKDSRKAKNLRLNPRIAFVIGGPQQDAHSTVQYEGVADFPEGDELVRVKAEYFRVFPDGREREKWPDITYVRTRPRWIRYSDFGQEPPRIEEVSPEQLEAWQGARSHVE